MTQTKQLKIQLLQARREASSNQFQCTSFETAANKGKEAFKTSQTEDFLGFTREKKTSIQSSGMDLRSSNDSFEKEMTSLKNVLAQARILRHEGTDYDLRLHPPRLGGSMYNNSGDSDLVYPTTQLLSNDRNWLDITMEQKTGLGMSVSLPQLSGARASYDTRNTIAKRSKLPYGL